MILSFICRWVTYSDFYLHQTRWCRWCQWEDGPGTQCSVTARRASPFHPLLCGGPECFPKHMTTWQLDWLSNFIFRSQIQHKKINISQTLKPIPSSFYLRCIIFTYFLSNTSISQQRSCVVFVTRYKNSHLRLRNQNLKFSIAMRN